MRGWQIHQQDRPQEAEQIYRKVLAEHPGDANGWCFLGIALHDQHQYESAVESYRRAIDLQPEFPIALNNLGNSLRYIHQPAEADRCFLRAIELKPDYLNAYKNRGTLHVWTGNLELGLQCYQEGLKLDPNEAELHRNLGVIHLLKGDFEKGWEEYRWRWRVGDLNRPFRNLRIWKGEELKGRSIVLTAEQGLGDTINFVRFAKAVQQLGATTYIYCQPALVNLLQQTSDLGPVIPNNSVFQTPVHFQCSLLDVADVLKVTEPTIPHENSYLNPAPHLVDLWREKITASDAKKRVGIAWQGNPDHQADAFRSFPLRYFESLSSLPGLELWSLQSGFGSEQLKEWNGAQPIRTIPDLDKNHGAFMDSAAIMKSLDLFVTSDTALAHLAGALGIPTWIVLGYMPDWRWLLSRENSPWYPSVRLFRQPKMGDWQSVFDQMTQALREEDHG